MSTIGIITVRGKDYHPTRRLAEAAEERGHRVTAIHPYEVWPGYENGRPVVTGLGQEELPHAVLPRQGAEVGNSCLALIRHFSLMGVPVINGFDAVRASRNQFYSLQALSSAGIPFPDTVFVNDKEGIANAVDRVGGFPVVAKQVSGRQGSGIALLRSRRDAERMAGEGLDRRAGLLIQRFIPPAGRRDLRCFVIGKTVTAAVELRPPEGDFRANFHISGKALKTLVGPETADMAIAAAGALGLEIAGVDLMIDAGGGPLVVEVNYSPGFKGLEAATGLDIAGRIVDHALERAAQR